jgi:hypothetical protein
MPAPRRIRSAAIAVLLVLMADSSTPASSPYALVGRLRYRARSVGSGYRDTRSGARRSGGEKLGNENDSEPENGLSTRTPGNVVPR